MTTATGHNQQVGKLLDLIREMRVGMLTTMTANNSLRSRPMITRWGADGELWFFTHAGDAKVDEALQHPRVNVSYSEPGQNRFVSISGSATLVHDQEKMRRLWDESERQWFPRGLDDPDLALLCVAIERAEYWDAATGSMAEFAFEDVKIAWGNED